MTVLLIVLIVVVIVVIGALLATSPLMRKREDAAIAAVKERIGADNVKVIEPRTTAMGSDPESAGGLRGMVCLAASETELVARSWTGQHDWSVPRSSVTGIDTTAPDPESVHKASITVFFTTPEGEASAMFRLRDAADWLDEFGYDWGAADSEVDDAD